MADGEPIPLCVDLDGTLVKTDTMQEQILILIKANPLHLVSILLWYFRLGRAGCKAEIARRVDFDPALLPYDSQVVDYVMNASQLGRPIYLVTGADLRTADAVARYLKIFDGVMASDGRINLTSTNKRDHLIKEFGDRGFDYIGNSNADWAVWDASRVQVGANLTTGIARRFMKNYAQGEKLSQVYPAWKPLIKAMRPHQWSKNFLILIPMMMAHRYLDIPTWLNSAAAFIAFSLVASSVYVINDLLDLPSDRTHPDKRHRPFACGDLQLVVGMVTAPFVALLGFVVALAVSFEFFGVVVGYLALTSLYSFYLKQIMMLDVITLAHLYAVRIFAGSVADDIEVSQWLLAFSVFFFLALALAKRVTELAALQKSGREKSKGRGYEVVDIGQLAGFGAASAYISILVLALYITAAPVVMQYARPHWLWVLCPLLLYWSSRVLMLARRGDLHSDPIVFALRDRGSYVVGALAVVVFVMAKGAIG